MEYLMKIMFQLSLVLILLSLSQGCATYKSFGKPSNTIKSETINYGDGSVYRGTTHNGVPYGAGKLRYSDGSTYNGEFKDGRQHGIGYMEFPNGSIYCGEFKTGQQDGKGYFRMGKDKSRYIGEWRGGKENGHGTIIFSNGSIHVGEFKDGMMHGVGTFHRIDGTNGSGIFVENKCIFDPKAQKKQR